MPLLGGGVGAHTGDQTELSVTRGANTDDRQLKEGRILLTHSSGGGEDVQDEKTGARPRPQPQRPPPPSKAEALHGKTGRW